ncbi:hypothetical protein DI383_03025 [Flavobacteriaceae bacterium LYZ1037]|nr:hypothetical protein DI383_03025 [Flavobacteriaceae bacterium LYZ1037]
MFCFNSYSQTSPNLLHSSSKNTYVKQKDSTALEENTEIITKSELYQKKRDTTVSIKILEQPKQKSDDKATLKNKYEVKN